LIDRIKKFNERLNVFGYSYRHTIDGEREQVVTTGDAGVFATMAAAGYHTGKLTIE
jgi:hypothetical protein